MSTRQKARKNWLRKMAGGGKSWIAAVGSRCPAKSLLDELSNRAILKKNIGIL